ncbi:MAG: hypothetical protein HYX97_03025 [Chloroflexi bacterium]|nr:hypothetical protein [Chloroflexota bacterium]
MKVKSVFAGFLHSDPGHHKAFNTWHDYDHRPENHGPIPHIFHSQRWVAPPDYVKLRGAVNLPKGGGQYFAMYWSTATAEQLAYDMTVVREKLRVLGRCGPIDRDFTAVWRDRMHFVSAQVRPGLALSADAVPVSPHKGIIAVLGEVIDMKRRDEYAQWDEMVHVPDVLSCKGVMAAFKFMPMKEEDHHIYLKLHYLDGDPLQVMEEIRKNSPQWRAKGHYLDNLDGVRRNLILSLYRPITPGQYDFYD